MEDYRNLFSLQIDHEYFNSHAGLFIEVRLHPESLGLLRQRQLIFKKSSPNRWELIGNVEGGGVCEGRDKLKMEFILNDAAFNYYTEWQNYDREAYYELVLSGKGETLNIPEVLAVYPKEKRKKDPGVLFSGELELTGDMFENARQNKGEEVHLKFATKEMVWEYLFIPRNPTDKEFELVLEERSSALLFSAPEFVYVDFLGQSAYRFVSQSAIGMRDEYAYELDLLEIPRKFPEAKHRIVKNIGYPVPGEFYDVKGNILRKVEYF